ncbi:MAG TPA: WYL domain-containing protein, partial [Solirubrobacteraceae bacterium]|nr:WYL domain-containing protein [Solirubrobacteraceae bacterium]
HLLDGEFAYAEPLRLALQQISWGRPSPLSSPEQQTVALGITGSPGGHDISQRLAKIETAIFRRKTIVFDYYTMERDAVGSRRVDPYQLLYQGNQFYLVGRSHERDAIRVFRLSRIRGKVGYATKAEHDFQRPRDFDPRTYAERIQWQFGDPLGSAEVWISGRIAWQIERDFGRHGQMRPTDDGDRIFTTPYANARQLISWVLGRREHMRVLGPPELLGELRERVELLIERHSGEPEVARPAARPADQNGARAERDPDGSDGTAESAIRPERFARLVTLATILLEAGRAARRLDARKLRESLKLSEQELREDISVLNVVNFGAGTYVLYAEIADDEMIDVDPEPYGDSFDRPARLLPVEAKALIAAIDLLGEHIPQGSLASVRAKVVAALGEDPVSEGLQFAPPGGDDVEIATIVSRAIAAHRMLSFEYYKENEDEFVERRVEPYALINGREGWYVASYDPARQDVRHFRLDRIKSATVSDETFEPRTDLHPEADVDGWPRTGEVPSSRRARIWISPERARWAREERTVVTELQDGAVIVELGFAGIDWLVREVLKEAGDAVVLEPPEARDAVREAALAIQGASLAA